MPESSDLVIFVMTDDRQTDRRTEPIALSLAHARRVTICTLNHKQLNYYWGYDKIILSINIR